MNDVRGFVKCALGFIITIVIIAGAVFGFDIDVKVEDTQNPTLEETETSTKPAVTTTVVATTATTKAPAVTTATEDKQESVVTSTEKVTVSGDKTEQTEGEKNNA